MSEIRLSYKDNPEEIIRKSLYWCSHLGEWNLKKESSEWVIQIDDSNNDFKSVFEQHLNDFKLRYELDKQTGYLRNKITKAALQAVLKNVKQS